MKRGPDNCPKCGRLIRDYDMTGCEEPNGQRWCIEHLPPPPSERADSGHFSAGVAFSGVIAAATAALCTALRPSLVLTVIGIVVVLVYVVVASAWVVEAHELAHSSDHTEGGHPCATPSFLPQSHGATSSNASPRLSCSNGERAGRSTRSSNGRS